MLSTGLEPFRASLLEKQGNVTDFSGVTPGSTVVGTEPPVKEALFG